MKRGTAPLMLSLLISLPIASSHPSSASQAPTPPWMAESTTALEAELTADYGAGQATRARRGIDQVADFWRSSDGDRQTFETFVRRNFAGDEVAIDTAFSRFEKLLEKLDGHMNEITLAFREQSDLDLGPILPFDEIFAAYDPSAHIGDDFFANKLAFVVLLNFPLTTLEERLAEGEAGPAGSGRRPASPTDSRSASRQRCSRSWPGPAQSSDQYIAEYNIWMHHLLDDDGERLFPPKMRLLSHWNLRDEIKANYGNAENGLAKQRMIQKVMERIVDQTIPEVVVDNPHVDWNPYTNEVTVAAVSDVDAAVPADLEISNAPRTRHPLRGAARDAIKASRLVDPYSPTAPTLIARRFNENREIPEERVRQCSRRCSPRPSCAQTAKLIESRLGRPLEPFDIWYNGFRSSGSYSEAELDAITRERYPTPAAYERDMAESAGRARVSTKPRAAALAANIVVDPARGSGHAWGAGMRDAKSHLRTRVGADGMDYKGFNIAVHEMGHNVEQTISLNDIDHSLLQGVPNTAFTEALAFVFQARDLELLGLASPDARRRVR